MKHRLNIIAIVIFFLTFSISQAQQVKNILYINSYSIDNKWSCQLYESTSTLTVNLSAIKKSILPNNAIFIILKQSVLERYLSKTAVLISACILFIILSSLLYINIKRRIKQQKEIAQNVESSFYNMIESASEAIVIIQNGAFVYTNNKFQEILGYTDEEIIGRNMTDFVHKDSLELVKQRYTARLRGEDVPKEYEIKAIHKTGSINNIILSAGVINYKGIKSDYVLLKDITENKKALEEIKELKERYANIFNNTISPSLLLDGEIIIDCNNSAVDFFKAKNKEDIIGKTPFFLSPEYQPNRKPSKEYAKEKINECFKKGNISFKWNHKDFNNTIKPAVIFLNIIKSSDKELIFVSIENLTDISELKDLQQKTEKKFNTIFNSSQLPMLIMNEALITECNDAAVSLFKANSKEDLIGKSTIDLSPEKQLNELTSFEMADGIKFLFDSNGKADFEWTHQSLTGELLYCKINMTLINFNNGENNMISIIEEISKNNV